MSPAYMEIVDFIAACNPEAVIAFRPSEAAEGRLRALVGREDLSEDERAELGHFMALEHIMRMAKAKARLIVRSSI